MRISLVVILVLAVCMGIGYGLAYAGTYPATPQNAKTVLAAAKPGDKIVLGSGVYSLSLANVSYNPPLVIDAAAATLDRATLTNVRGVQFVGGTFVNGCVSTPCVNAGLRVHASDGVSSTGAKFVGPESMADGYGSVFTKSANVAVLNAVFMRFKVGFLLSETKGFKLTDSRFIDMRADGFNLGYGAQDGVVERNYCDGTSITSDEHPDCGQLYNRPGYVIRNINIAYNVAHGNTQGFSAFNHVRNGIDDGGFDDLRFVGNTVYGTYPQALAIYDCRNCVARDNHVFTLPGSKYRASFNTERSTFLVNCGNNVAPGAGKVGVAAVAC